MTRAADRLIMCGIGEFEGKPKVPSRFLADLPTSVVFKGFQSQGPT